MTQIDLYLKKKNIIKHDDTYYTPNHCVILYPSDYELIERKERWIQIKYKNKQIKLYYNEPRTFKELGLVEDSIN